MRHKYSSILIFGVRLGPYSSVKSWLKVRGIEASVKSIGRYFVIKIENKYKRKMRAALLKSIKLAKLGLDISFVSAILWDRSVLLGDGVRHQREAIENLPKLSFKLSDREDLRKVGKSEKKS